MAQRAGRGASQAACITMAIADVIDETVQGRLVAKVAESLPAGIRQLITAGSNG